MSQSERDSNNHTGVSGAPDPPSAISIDLRERHTAHVRYFVRRGGEVKQIPLSNIGERIPEDAFAASTGIYFLTANQEDRLHKGFHSKRLQIECEKDARVAYAVVAESDALENQIKASEVMDWLTTFAEDWIDKEDYTLYYSGNRSIHLHMNRYVTSGGLDDLKRLAKQFNDQYDADLDTSIYKPKAQFRLKGAKHRKTGFYKIPIRGDEDRAELIRRAQDAPNCKGLPHTLPEPRHHDYDDLSRSQKQFYSNSPYSSPHYIAGDAELAPLPQEFRDEVLWGVFKGDSDDERDPSQLFSHIPSHPVSPYANTGDGERSVIVLEQIGSPRSWIIDRSVYVPAHVLHMVGGDGEFSRSYSETLVKLSSRDFRKWTYSTGDNIIIIGGRSRSSRIFAVEGSLAEDIAVILEGEGREKAIDTLSDFGFDVGSTGYNGGRFSDKEGKYGPSQAAKIKREIEEGTRETSYENVFRVVCRLLQTDGWDAAFQWCRKIYESDFDPEKTCERLEKIVETYDDYSHINIPENPQ